MTTQHTQPKKNRKPSSRQLRAAPGQRTPAPGEIALYEELFDFLVKYGPDMFYKNIWDLLAKAPKGTGYSKAEILRNEFLFILWRNLNRISDDMMLLVTMAFDKSTRFEYAHLPHYTRRVHMIGWLMNNSNYYTMKRYDPDWWLNLY